jgi:hypothetical protein
MKSPATTTRVMLHSAELITHKIEREMELRLWYYLDHIRGHGKYPCE